MSQAPLADTSSTASAASETPVWIEQLPGYAKSLLRIELPVSVTLASKRIPVSEVLQIVSGAIIQFDKQCDEPITLEVGNRTIAEGEAVKIGDKFGIRISTMLPPDERFHPVKGHNKESDS